MTQGRTRRVRITTRAAIILAGAIMVAACGGSDDDASTGGSTSVDKQADLVLYSGRSEDHVGKLYENFEKDTGIKLEVRYAESSELTATLLEEGDNSKADVFYAQDAGAIGALEAMLKPLPQQTLDKVDARFRDPEGKWIGVTGRVRTLIYNTDTVTAGELPKSVYDVVDEKWNGKVGVAPNNASFQAFVTAMRLQDGEQKTAKFLSDLAANEPRTYEKNSQVAKAAADGEIDVGLVNHYYLYELLAEDPDAKVANHFFQGTDPGTFINVSAIAALDSTEHADEAQRFIDYMMNDGQVFFAEESDEREYPLSGAEKTRAAELPPLESFQGAKVDLSVLGNELEASVRMIDEAGLATA